MAMTANDQDADCEPFLEPEAKVGWASLQKRNQEKKTGVCLKTRQIWLHLFLIVIYGIASVAYVHFKLGKSRMCLGSDSSINNLDIKPAFVKFHNLSRSHYAAEPPEQLDKAWDSLLQPMNIRVTREELRRERQESVALPEGGGFMAWLGVYHNLHCINMLRRWVHPGFYQVNATEEEKDHYFPHVEHCIELLRQNAMCQPDLSLTTFKWDPEEERPMFNASESVHKCVDWAHFLSSLESRLIPVEELSRLQNPLMISI